MGQRVLITRISWFLAHRIARRLEDDPNVEYILGVDIEEPRGDLDRTEFLKADFRRAVMLKILDATGIDTVVHCGLYSTPEEARGRSAMHDLNVIGAMQLLGACQKAETVKRVVVRSSTAVYGAESNDPAAFSEEMGRSSARDPFGRDCVEMEAYVREFRRRRREVDLTVFRFANILGPRSDTPLAQYLRMPVVPTVLGFDPRLQFMHEDDAVDLMLRAVRDPVVGTYNATGDGVLYLSQVLRIGRRVELPLPMPILNMSAALVSLLGRGLVVPPHILRLLQWGRVADNARLTGEFGFTPKYTSSDVVREFYADERLRRVAAAPAEQRWERELHEFLTRKGQERFLARARSTRLDGEE
jgi:UDP-glucose 4-epimerase